MDYICCVVFNVDNGRIRTSGKGNASNDPSTAYEPEELLMITEAEFDALDQGKMMVDIASEPKVLVDRPEMAYSFDKLSISADGVDEAVMSGLPNPITVRVFDNNDWHDYIVTDGSFEVSANNPKDIRVSIEEDFPYKVLDITVSAL